VEAVPPTEGADGALLERVDAESDVFLLLKLIGGHQDDFALVPFVVEQPASPSARQINNAPWAVRDRIVESL
jgi:hypothetical protein